jgi:hypothetical protein
MDHEVKSDKATTGASDTKTLTAHNMIRQDLKSTHRWLDFPEVNVAIFAFLLNFVWEMWQVPFFARIQTLPHWEGVKICSQATFGDVIIALIAFWSIAVIVRSRSWIKQPNGWEIAGFIVVGVLITIGLEALATDVLGRWQYGDSMPTLPVLGTGLLPLLQWLLLPPLVLWFVRRQLT